ncbi:uncharacterized protein PRCAT00004881001 [Priceomyces carsonii]|uniref:uncharacterized protein n=1 Tax=Priceomyces carsonii TaxID=28549 RepID=UPI002EDB4394|nr:unnamed protein product [Priceomyces carsonii]
MKCSSRQFLLLWTTNTNRQLQAFKNPKGLDHEDEYDSVQERGIFKELLIENYVHFWSQKYSVSL